MRNEYSTGGYRNVPPGSVVRLSKQGGTGDRTPSRRSRVDVLKKVIIGAVVLAMLLPTVISLLVLKSLRDSVGRLEEEISALSEAVEELDMGEPVGRYGNSRLLLDGTYVGEPITWSDGTRNLSDQSGEIGVRKVYLTFDDGPSGNTGRILDILNEYGVKATFFVVGKDEPYYTDLYRRITEEGHTIGMHSYSHRYGQIYRSGESFREDLEKIQSLIYDTTGVWPVYYRFPGGSSNSVSGGRMNEFISFLNEEDIIYYDWNVSAGDAESVYIGKQQIVDRCIAGINKFPGQAVVLFHDSDERNSTVEALPEIIEAVLAMPDTEILPITEDTIPVRHVKLTGENEDMEGQ